MRLYFLLFTHILLFAEVPSAYNNLGQSINNELPILKELMHNPHFTPYKQNFDLYFDQTDNAFILGHKLDEEISKNGRDEKRLQGAYLKALRSLQSIRLNLKKLYYKEILHSINMKDNKQFLFLLENGSVFLNENKLVKPKVFIYAQDQVDLKKHKIIKAYAKEKALDDRSYAYAQKMQEEYKAYQEVLRKQEAIKLRKLLVAKKKGGVLVYAQEEKGDISFFIENLFEMHVSATLHVKDIRGYESNMTLPYKLVLKPRQKSKLLKLNNISGKKKVGHFSSHLSWAKGAVDAQEELNYIYALPFHKSHKVSQGFNGNTSHKGTAKYAIDFSMPVGTAIYAARGGKVVEIVQHHDKHGMSTKMSAYANYVIIEHEDKTLARYFHLKHQGAKVKLAQVVKQGELIALSGNTGRTSGPHLHFVVTKAQEYKGGYRSVSVPIKFNCSEGVIDNPISGHTYCYVK